LTNKIRKKFGRERWNNRTRERYYRSPIQEPGACGGAKKCINLPEEYSITSLGLRREELSIEL
jgi:hypothetical protein